MYIIQKLKSLFKRLEKLLSLNQKVEETIPFIDYIGSHYIYRGQDGCDKILNTLQGPDPCLIARYGTTELSTLFYYETHRRDGVCKFPQELKTNISDLSGFFPAENSQLTRFCHEFIDCINDVDVMGVRWEKFDDCFWKHESFATEKHCPTATLVGIEEIIAPFFNKNPWMQYLEGKKVLVVHPFEQTIKTQYVKRKLLFKEDKNLPDFQLITLRAVQSLADEKIHLSFKDWFEALKHMERQIEKIDFDVAIIGAGAYGIFLGRFCKSLGKKAIHMGGATQVLFGIKGKRWVDVNNVDSLAHIMNEHWVYPGENEIPKGGQRVENGCYW